MKRYLYLFCQIIVILFFISCEKQDIIKLKDSEKVQFSSAKKPFEFDFSDFDFNKYNIEPIWSQAIELPGKVLEVPFKVKNKTFRPKLDSYKSRNNEASARLILYKESGITVAKIIYYFPGVNFKGNLDEINANTIKSLKFSGLYMHQKLGESETHIRFTEEGKITDRKTGTKDEAKKNGRIMACQLWGVFHESYNEYGQLIDYELLWSYKVCDGGDPTQDQAPPGASGGFMDYAVNDGKQLLIDVKTIFNWLSGTEALAYLFSDIEFCNVYAFLGYPLGDPMLQTSYYASSGVVGLCHYGQWTPTGNGIMNIRKISPDSDPIKVYEIQSIHNGNIDIDIEGAVSAAQVQVSGRLKLVNTYGEQKFWYREK